MFDLLKYYQQCFESLNWQLGKNRELYLRALPNHATMASFKACLTLTSPFLITCILLSTNVRRELYQTCAKLRQQLINFKIFSKFNKIGEILSKLTKFWNEMKQNKILKYFVLFKRNETKSTLIDLINRIWVLFLEYPMIILLTTTSLLKAISIL